ncbi:MAG: protein kinase [Polyangiaceae bacterium]
MPDSSPPKPSAKESTAPQAPMLTQLGRYEVRAKLAEGGMASLYLGRLHGAEGFERPVALKVIKDQFLQNREFVTMFMDEARIVARVSHPNVVQIYELGNEKDRLFIAMELLVGQSLWNVWQACRERTACLRLDLIAWIGARVGEGLHHAHELTGKDGKSIELVHRDVNASNIFVTYDGHVKLIDFGLVKATNRVTSTIEGIVKGKLAYLSPEQALGKKVDRRTDIFALGATLWELTTDRRLFKRDHDLDTLRLIKDAVVPDPTELVAGYPPKLWATLKRALSKDKNDRYPTMKEFVKDLDECATAEGRAVSSNTLSEVMIALFGKERDRQRAWLDEQSETPLAELSKPPAPYEATLSFAEMGSVVQPSAGTLVPLSAREAPTPSKPPSKDAEAPTKVEKIEKLEQSAPLAKAKPAPRSSGQSSGHTMKIGAAIFAFLLLLLYAIFFKKS